jgi:hypothetical protein
MLKRLKFEIDQLVSDMLDKIPLEMWESETTTFLDPAMGGGQFIRAIIETLREYGHSDENIKGRVFGIEDSQLRVNFVVNKYNLIGTYISTDFLSWETDMKFDNIVGNFPYQKQVGPTKTEPIWDKFVKKSFELLKEDGYAAFVHPAGWRNVDGRFSYVRDLLLSKQMEYLEIHNEKDGMSTFGAKTRYDWYIVKNTTSPSDDTLVTFEDGGQGKINLKKLNFIPNHSLENIVSLLADPGEEVVEVLYSRSAYGTDKKHINTTQTEVYKYPVVYTVRANGELILKYSSINSNGHFGSPKVIMMPATGTGRFVDENGEYGLTQFCYAIVDIPENLPLIKKALDSKEFSELMSACSMGLNGYNHKVISLFRKDFWKEFV